MKDALKEFVNAAVDREYRRLSGALDAGDDPELAELAAHFDRAPDLLEAYHRADPFLNGEAAAMAAATRSVFGAGRSSGAHRASDGSDALENEMRRFDEVMNGGAPVSGQPQRTKSEVVAQSSQLSQFKETAEYMLLSDAQRAEIDDVLADAEARLAAITGAA